MYYFKLGAWCEEPRRDEVARVEYLTAALLNLIETYGEMRVLNRVHVLGGLLQRAVSHSTDEAEQL